MKFGWVFLLLFSIPCFSQQNKEIAEFNATYYKSIDKLRELYIERGSELICDLPSTVNFFDELKSQVKAYEKAKNKNTCSILFYSYDSTELKIWLIGSQRYAYSHSSITPDSLIKLEKDMRGALKVSVLSRGRKPIKRNAIELLDNEDGSINIDTAIKHLTDVLLPFEIRKALTGTSKLIVYPEYNIGQVPFYVLKPYEWAAYLIDSMAVTFAPHLCNFDAFMQNEVGLVGGRVGLSGNTKSLVIGDPDYSDNVYTFPRLPGARSEASMIAGTFDAQLLLGNEAAKNAVIQRAQSAELLYFATHGVYDNEKVLDGSFLALTPDSSSTTGFWTAREIQTTNLDTVQIAILSACQTGVGKVVSAGFIGVGRAFYKAGVENTVMSLWSVDDIATQQLMELFVAQLHKGYYFFPAENLRQAILEFKKKDPNPAHWAPFVNFGFCY